MKKVDDAWRLRNPGDDAKQDTEIRKPSGSVMAAVLFPDDPDPFGRSKIERELASEINAHRGQAEVLATAFRLFRELRELDRQGVAIEALVEWYTDTLRATFCGVQRGEGSGV